MRHGRAIHGIVGLISLTMCAWPRNVFSVRRLGLTPNELSAEYLILITNRERFGGISTNDIFNANEFEIMPLNPDVSVQNPSHPVEAYLLALVKSHLNGGSFFFSYTWDLTRRLQVQWLEEKADAGKALWEAVGIVLNCVTGRIPNEIHHFRQTTGFSGISEPLGNPAARSTTNNIVDSCSRGSSTSPRPIRTKTCVFSPFVELSYQTTVVVGIHHANDLRKLVPSLFCDCGHRLLGASSVRDSETNHQERQRPPLSYQPPFPI